MLGIWVYIINKERYNKIGKDLKLNLSNNINSDSKNQSKLKNKVEEDDDGEMEADVNKKFVKIHSEKYGIFCSIVNFVVGYTLHMIDIYIVDDLNCLHW